MITHDLRVLADAMLDKKGQRVVGIDLRPLGVAITDHFVICSADSTTNVAAIADNVIEKMRTELGRKPLRSQGFSVTVPSAVCLPSMRRRPFSPCCT